MGILDKLPLATITFLVGTVLTVIAYLSDDLSIIEAFAALGFTGLGAGQIGQARNGAGRGIK
jgi:uncharacterized membrane protein YtjA (UPF0391 family)